MGDKFYAVAHGKKPGVYEEWSEVQEQIKGFPQPVYKKFTSKEEADEYVKAREHERVSMDVDESAKKFYTVARGKVIGIFTDFDEVKKHIADYPQPMYKKFESLDEAKEYFKKQTTGEDSTRESKKDEEKESKEDKSGHEEKAKAGKEHKHKEHRDRDHRDRDHKDREHRDREHRDRDHKEHGDKDHKEHTDKDHKEHTDKDHKEHGDKEHTDKDHKDKDHTEKDHKDKEHGDEEPKAKSYYAVARGHKTGVYETWAECQEQTKDFRGAKYKKFADEEEAKMFAEGCTLNEIEERKRPHEKEEGEDDQAEHKKVAKKVSE